MTTKNPPAEGQRVQVKLYNGEWQDATWKGGAYIDGYGLPLDPTRISQWRPALLDRAPIAQRPLGDAAQRFATALR